MVCENSNLQYAYWLVMTADKSDTPKVSAFGFIIDETQKELFGDEQESSSFDGEWSEHEEDIK